MLMHEGEEAADSLQLWLAMIREANRLADRLSAPIAEKADEGDWDGDMMRLVGTMATMSTATRQRAERNLQHLLRMLVAADDDLDAAPPAPSPTLLRPVPVEGDPPRTLQRRLPG